VPIEDQRDRSWRLASIRICRSLSRSLTNEQRADYTERPTRLAAFECKRPGGKLTGARQDFCEWCQSSGWDHVSGGVEEVRDWLASVRAPATGLTGVARWIRGPFRCTRLPAASAVFRIKSAHIRKPFDSTR
jgi:hypothetical protein